MIPGPRLFFFAASILIAVALPFRVSTTEPTKTDELWYGPNPGSLDLRRMFEHPEEWDYARALISVFKFTQQHTYATPDPITGPNTYDALVRSGAFRSLTRWKKKIAIGVGSVKPGHCTADASGMQAAINDTMNAVAAVQAGGGVVQYLAMDEPFLSGQFPVCGGPAFEPTADRLAVYMFTVQRAHPLIRIGMIEAYPSFNPDGFQRMLDLMQARGIPPAFLHIDTDLRALRKGRDDFARDMRRVQEMCAAQDIPFGMIIWGYNGDVDTLFVQDAEQLAGTIHDTFATWETMPDQIILESWSESSTGLRITPSNLPEDRQYTLTNLLWSTARRFRADGSAAVGRAVPRGR